MDNYMYNGYVLIMHVIFSIYYYSNNWKRLVTLAVNTNCFAIITITYSLICTLVTL